MTRTERAAPVLGFFLALLLYLLTRVNGYMPGESAFALTQALPDSMFPTFGHTLWHSLIAWLDRLPGPLFTSVGIFSALVGAVSAAAAIYIIQRVSIGETPEEQRTPISPAQARGFMAGATFLTFVFSPPLWFGATRPLPQMFGLMCLLLVGAATVETFRRRSPLGLNLVAILWGWLVTEYATAWFFLGFFAIAVLLSGFDLQGRFRWGRNLRIAALFLIGAGLGYLWMSVRVLGHRHAPFQDITSLSAAWWNSLKVQKNLILQAAPLQGSLLVFFLFGGPFLLVFWPKRHGTLEVRIGSVMLHTACLIICGIMLFHPPVSPWGMYLGGRLGVFMVAPSAMLALSTGYLCGYFRNVLATYDPYLPFYLRAPRWVLRLLALPVMATLLGASTFLNIRAQRDPELRAVNRLAAAMAEAIAPYDTWIGDSGFNDVLRLHLRERGASTRILDLNPALWQREVYRKILAATFADRPRLATLAEIGPIPLLHAWAAEDGGFGDRVLLGDHPDILVRAGLTAVPVPYGYRGRASADPDDLARAVAALLPLWESGSDPSLWASEDGAISQHRAAVALRMFYAMESRRANNLGVLLEAADRFEEARNAYRAARRLRADNLSALLNLSLHLPALPPQEQQAVQRDVDNLLANLGGRRYQQWRLAEIFGYVSHPLAHMQRGMAWAVSGKPDLAAREYEAALRRAPGAELLRLQLAQARLADQDLEGSETEFLRVLANHPDSQPALLGLTRLSAQRGDLIQANRYLARLRELGADPAVLYREEIALLILAGRLPEAAARADAWMREQPGSPKPVIARLAVAAEARDSAAISKLRQRLDDLPNPPADDRLAAAQLLFAMGDTPSAQRWLRPVIEAEAPPPAAAELALRIALTRRSREDAERWVRYLLAQTPSHPLANYVLGTLRYFDGRLREAEAAFRASLAAQPAASTHNDLAALLAETGRPDEALIHCQAAIQLEPRAPAFWDTRADILLRLGRVEEARESIARALAAAPEFPPFQLTLARILAASGGLEEARLLIERLLADPSSLSPAQRRELAEVAERVRKSH